MKVTSLLLKGVSCIALAAALFTAPSPAPVQAEPDYNVGAFYFSDWNPELGPFLMKNTEKLYGRDGDWMGGIKDHLTAAGPWGYGPITDREPLGGWYDDREQSVMDTHILQASSRGLGHFAFYYYWKDNGGGERPGQNVHQFQSSPYKDLMKFYLYMMADGKWPASDWDKLIVPNLVQFMKDSSYQRTPDGRPIVGFYGDFESRLGGKEQWKKALATLRTQAKAAGLKNPLLLVNGYRELAPSIEQGFDGFLPLNLAGIGLDGSQGNTADYSVYPKAWKDFVYKTYPKGSKSENYENYLLIPGGISGFDTRSWRGIGYGDHDGVEKSAYLNPSPDKFRVQAANVKDYLDTHPRSMNMATFYAWNEFGEGGAIEPTTQYGFGYVNALQETFHLDNSRYRTRVAKEGLENWDPALRLEFAPVQTSVTKGAALRVKGKVTNQGSTAIRQGTVTLDAGAWKSKGLSGTDLTGLKPGETRQVEFEAAAGDGEDWTKHELNLSAAYETGGRKAVENTSTFVVETPDVHGVIEPITGPVFGGDKLSLELNLIRYTPDAAAGHYRIEAPEGWSLSGRSEGSFSFTGKKPENGKALSAAAQLTLPKEVTDGSYPVTLVVSSQGRETRSSITLSVGNSLANPGFEKDKDKNGLADGWLAMTGKEAFELSGDKHDGSVSQKLTAQGFGAGIRQEWLALDPKKTYVVEAWVKVEAGTLNIAEAEADAGFKNFLGFTVQKQVSNRDWQKISFTVKPKPGGVNGSIRFLSWSSGKTVAYIDHVVFRPAAD